MWFSSIFKNLGALVPSLLCALSSKYKSSTYRSSSRRDGNTGLNNVHTEGNKIIKSYCGRLLLPDTTASTNVYRARATYIRYRENGTHACYRHIIQTKLIHCAARPSDFYAEYIRGKRITLRLVQTNDRSAQFLTCISPFGVGLSQVCCRKAFCLNVVKCNATATPPSCNFTKPHFLSCPTRYARNARSAQTKYNI